MKFKAQAENEQNYNEDDEDAQTDKKGFKGDKIRPISVHNEKKSLKKIKEYCEKLLSQYDTTYEVHLQSHLIGWSRASQESWPYF